MNQDQTKHPPTGGPPLRLGVVVPLANEQDTVDDLIKQVTAHLSQHDRLFCVLDHVSKDATLDRVRAAGETDPRVVTIWAPENRCVVDAYLRGYREALAAGCRWILEMDGGFSHRPDQIPRFIAAMERSVDFAGGSRFCRGGEYIGIGWRYVLSRGGTVLTNIMLGTRMKDMTSGFECFTREALQHVVDTGVRSRAHFFQTEIRYMMHRWNWVEVPITYKNPSKRVGRSTIVEAFGNLWWLFRQSRLAIRKAST